MKTLQPIFSAGMASLAFLPCINLAAAQKTASKPNIIYIYADDLGYGDVACYGNKYVKTPNIDRMAKEGIRFTQHYSSAPVSAPARCGLMTGMHLGHGYIRNNFEIKGTEREAGQMPIPADTETIAKMLKRAGYVTGLIGKWGLGSMASTGAPGKQGFDFFYGYNDQNHAHNHYPSYLWRNDTMEKTGNPEFTVHPKFNATATHDDQEYKQYMGPNHSLDLMGNEALKFIEENREKPFFLYLAFVVPHKALQIPDESLEMYNGVFNEKHYNGGQGYTPHPRPLSAYAAMITRLDQKIGAVLDQIKKLGLDENTIIMFSSDNGPAGGGGVDAAFFGSAGGFRGMKGQVYEGGIREPFVARWPGKINPGTVTDHVSAQYDLMATLGELTGQPVNNTDGISFLPTLLGLKEKQVQHAYLYWEFAPGGGQLAVRSGDWKGVKRGVSRNPDEKWEIYNLADDPAETKDLAAQHPELSKKFDQIVNRRTPSQHAPWNFFGSSGSKN